MLATILVLYSGKMLGKVSLPSLSSETFPKVWPLPLFYLGNLVFGLGSTQVLSLPMMTVLRRFSILMTLIGMIGSSIWLLLKTRCYCLGEYLILQTRPSLSVCASVFLMIFGAVVAAIDDIAFSMTGWDVCRPKIWIPEMSKLDLAIYIYSLWTEEKWVGGIRSNTVIALSLR